MFLQVGQPADGLNLPLEYGVCVVIQGQSDRRVTGKSLRCFGMDTGPGKVRDESVSQSMEVYHPSRIVCLVNRGSV